MEDTSLRRPDLHPHTESSHHQPHQRASPLYTQSSNIHQAHQQPSQAYSPGNRFDGGTQQHTAPGAYAVGISTPAPASQSSTNTLDRPAVQTAEVVTNSSATRDIPAEPRSIERSSLLSADMSNPQAGYYQMAAPMGGYQPQQVYGQGAVHHAAYYQPIPQLSGPIASSYVEPPRQGMRPLHNSAYDYQQVQYSQASYPTSYAPNYPATNSLMNPAYSAPDPQYQRPSPPATLAGPPVRVERGNKPQCWEHGCNGREFSTFSNLLRHQREKSGTATKSLCPHCGAEFTRSTARNGHIEHGKCKSRRPNGQQLNNSA